MKTDHEFFYTPFCSRDSEFLNYVNCHLSVPSRLSQANMSNHRNCYTVCETLKFVEREEQKCFIFVENVRKKKRQSCRCWRSNYLFVAFT